MFLKYLDFISPSINIYYKGNYTHSSIVSGIISIMAVIGIIYLAVYFSLDLIRRENPAAFYYNSYTQDAGIFEINTTSLFHFIDIEQNIRGKFSHEPINFTIFNVIGYQGALDNFLSIPQNRINVISHWLYGPCNKDIHGKNLSDLINSYDFFEQGACIQKYFDYDDQKYYEIGDPNFKWPQIAHGADHNNGKIYSLFLIKCNKYIINEVLGENYKCQEDNAFSQYFKIMGSRMINI